MYSNVKQIKTVGDMVQYYLHSPQFLALRPRTQKDSEYTLTKALKTSVSVSKTLESVRISKVSVADFQQNPLEKALQIMGANI